MLDGLISLGRSKRGDAIPWRGLRRGARPGTSAPPSPSAPDERPCCYGRWCLGWADQPGALLESQHSRLPPRTVIAHRKTRGAGDEEFRPIHRTVRARCLSRMWGRKHERPTTSCPTTSCARRDFSHDPGRDKNSTLAENPKAARKAPRLPYRSRSASRPNEMELCERDMV